MRWLGQERVIWSLEELSSKDLQRRYWLPSDRSEMSSLTEAIEGLFTDSGLDRALERGETGYSKEDDDKLFALGKMLSKVDQCRKPEEVINDPVMDKVRSAAAELLRSLKE